MAPRVPTYLSILLAISDAAPISAFAPVSGPRATANNRMCSPGRPTRQPKKSPRRTQLQVAKDNNRARLEKTWEDMMGDDWREFRARLVAQERAEAAVHANSKQLQAAASGQQDEENLTKIFTGAISSIFSSKGESSQKSAQKGNGANSIFDGDAVGGATEFSKHEISSSCQDPFLSAEECHIIYDPEVSINKHRWAHPLYHVEPGCVLIANERLGGVFHQTCILIIDHNEASGSTGVVINRPFPGGLAKVATEAEAAIDLGLKLAFDKAPVGFGGPVMKDQFSTLHGFGEVMGSKKVCPGVFVGGSTQLMQEVRQNGMDPSEVMFIKGHSAWLPGQLSREIEKGVWYVAAASEDLILRYAGAPVSKEDNPSDLWADILSCMGGKFEEIATLNSGKGDARMMP